MLISVCSDLHQEFSRGNLYVPPFQGEDVLILAGDIQMGLVLNEWFVELLKERDVIYVLGNHEFYKQDIDLVYNMLPSWEKAINEIAQELGYKGKLYTLQNKSVKLGDVTFIGTTLWTDYQNKDPYTVAAAPQLISDYTHINKGPNLFSPMDGLREFVANEKFLIKELAKEGKKVVITHHLPSFKSVHPRYLVKDEHPRRQVYVAMNHLFFSDLDHLVEQADVWVHGHTHDSFDYSIGNCRVVCNPKGYPKENMKPYAPMLVEV